MTAGRIYFFGIVIAYLLAILSSSGPPLLQDYPTWVYEGVAVSHLLTGHPEPQFPVKLFPVPNLLSDIGLGALCAMMDWRYAAKLWLCLYVLFAAYACLRFARSIRLASPSIYWLAPTMVIFNLCFWYGFLNFQLAVALLLLFCAVLYGGRAGIRGLAIMLCLLFLCHAIAFLVGALILASYVVLQRRYRLWLAFLPSVLLGVWYMYGRFVQTGNQERTLLQDAPVPYLTRAFAIYKINTYFKSLGYVNPQTGGQPIVLTLWGRWLLFALIAATCILGIALAAGLCSYAFRAMRSRSPERFLWIAVMISAVAALLSPSRALGISDPGSRFLVCALAVAIFLTGAEGLSGVVSSVASAALGVVGVALFVMSAHGASPEPVIARVPSIARQFAHVSPWGRAYYYSALERGDSSEPVFGTALLLNRSATTPRQQISSK